MTPRGDPKTLRRINTGIVLGVLRENGAATLSELARATPLSLATCRNIVTELLASGRVQERRERLLAGGRPARVYEYNPEYSLVLLLLPRLAENGEEVIVSVRNAFGDAVATKVVFEKSLTIRRLIDIVKELQRERPNIRAVAVSIPGVIVDKTIVSSDLPGLAGENVSARIHAETGLESVVENDMNFAAVGYYQTLPATMSSLAYVTIPRGEKEGAGIIADGRLIRGKSNFAGEIGFLPDQGGRGKKPTPAGRRRRTAELVTVLTTVLNPDVIVLSGDGAVGATPEAILSLVLRDIPRTHLPDLRIVPDFGPDCLAGMIRLAEEEIPDDITVGTTGGRMKESRNGR